MKRMGAVGLVACLVLVPPAEGQAPARKAPAPLMLPDPDWIPKPGDEVVVFSPKSGAVVAKDYSSFDDMIQSAKAKDARGIEEQIRRGELVLLPHMTRILVIELHNASLTRGVFSLEVRALEGDHKDKRFWMIMTDAARLKASNDFPGTPSSNPYAVPGSMLPRGKAKPVPKSSPPRAIPPEAKAAAELQMGKNLRFQGNRDAAAERFRGAIKLAPGSPAAKEAERILKDMGLKP